MALDMVCPSCNKLGFDSKFVWDVADRLKCEKCGEWDFLPRWWKIMGWKEYRKVIADVTAERDRYKTALEWISTREGVTQHAPSICQYAARVLAGQTEN